MKNVTISMDDETAGWARVEMLCSMTIVNPFDASHASN